MHEELKIALLNDSIDTLEEVIATIMDNLPVDLEDILSEELLERYKNYEYGDLNGFECENY